MKAPIRILRTSAELEQVGDAWDRLESSLKGPGQHSAWMRAAAATLARTRLQAITLGGDELRAAAPLVRRHGRYELATVRELGEPVDFLWRDEDSLAELCEALARNRVPLLLARTPSLSATFPALTRAYGRGAIQVAHPRPGLPFIALDETWIEPESHFNAGRRSDLRRARRRADAAGDVTVEFHTPTPEEVEPLLTEALNVEARSWKGRRGTALLQDPIRLPFYRIYALQAATDGMFRVSLLRVGGRAVAMQFGVERGRSLWLLKIGYDEAFQHASPGQLLMLEAVRHAAKLQLSSLELLGWSAAWTRLWATDERRFARVSFLPRRPRSIISLAEDELRETVRTLLRYGR